ncbi:MAG: hypothetical protein H0V78_01565 [Burkholderiales bacterium]|nr:hypothetical protein [Burkholderiales bacterium]
MNRPRISEKQLREDVTLKSIVEIAWAEPESQRKFNSTKPYATGTYLDALGTRVSTPKLHATILSPKPKPVKHSPYHTKKHVRPHGERRLTTHTAFAKITTVCNCGIRIAISDNSKICDQSCAERERLDPDRMKCRGRFRGRVLQARDAEVVDLIIVAFEWIEGFERDAQVC